MESKNIKMQGIEEKWLTAREMDGELCSIKIVEYIRVNGKQILDMAED